MTNQDAPAPGERRLASPPSERYRAAEAASIAPVRPASPGRGLVYATIAGLIGAVAVIVLGGLLAVTGGLLVVAAGIGWGTGWGLRLGAGTTIPDARRAVAAALIALVAIAIGQVGLWLYAAGEGGVLSLTDYLGEVFGPLVPLQAVVAPVVAWVVAR